MNSTEQRLPRTTDNPYYSWDPLPGRPVLRWPGQARVALCVLVHLEHVEDLPPPGTHIAPSTVGRGPYPEMEDSHETSPHEYGPRVGIFRIMEGLSRLSVPATMAIDAAAASQYPEVVQHANKLGWELAGHGPSSSGIITAKMSEGERLVVPEDVDGSRGTFRAPRASCALEATNDYQAVNAWLSLHEAAATRRAYRKEAERLILWAIVERGRALSSLTTEDAIAYRAFLRHPSPRTRWVGAPQPRSLPAWRPFAGDLSARSAAYGLSVLNALYRWLIEQRYVLANPFAGVKVRGGRPAQLDTSHAFTEHEWTLVRVVADGLEWSCGWGEPAAQRLRFMLDFAYATGLRISELVGAKLGAIDSDAHGDTWIRVIGKGRKAGKVVLPPLARAALDRYLAQRGLPVTPSKWRPSTPLIGSLGEDGNGISSWRLWRVLKRFFAAAAEVVEEGSPALAEKLRQATPHWTRHTHATHLLEGGAELTTVRDNLRHASLATTSMYLHTDDARRAKQVADQFAAQRS